MHSRISKSNLNANASSVGEDEKIAREKLLQLFMAGSSTADNLAMAALEDFIGDLCDVYMEYGAQYDEFSRFMRLFLWADFPPKITSSVLTKLRPILRLLTFEEERSDLFHSLASSISGGIADRRDPSDVLDLFAMTLVKSASVLSRSDYFYLLAISILGRNLASSFRRCECGLRAMERRLSGMTDSTVYDVYEVAKRGLCGKSGSKDELVTSLLDVCLDPSTALSEQEKSVQVRWSCACANKSWDVLNEELGR